MITFILSLKNKSKYFQKQFDGKFPIYEQLDIENIINNKVFIDSTVNYKKYEGNLIKWSAEHEFDQHIKNLNRKTEK